MNRPTVLFSTAGIVLTFLAVALWPARSDVSDDATLQAESSGPLDGLSFDGMFASPDGSSGRADVLHFGDGKFWSKICVPCGFPPGPYQARTTDEGVRFEGVLESPDRGRFRYTGIVKDGRIIARINWRKERWYWTIDKDFRFEGARAKNTVKISAESVTVLALTADPDHEKCRL